MDKPRQVQFREVTCLVPTAGREAELLGEAGAFLASITSFMAFSGILCARDGERMAAFQSFQSHFICSLNVLRGGLKNIGLII